MGLSIVHKYYAPLYSINIYVRLFYYDRKILLLKSLFSGFNFWHFSFCSSYYWSSMRLCQCQMFTSEPRLKKMCLRGLRTDEKQTGLSDIETRDNIQSRQRSKLRGCAGWSALLLFAYGIKHVFPWRGSISFWLGIKPPFICLKLTILSIPIWMLSIWLFAENMWCCTYTKWHSYMINKTS